MKFVKLVHSDRQIFKTYTIQDGAADYSIVDESDLRYDAEYDYDLVEEGKGPVAHVSFLDTYGEEMHAATHGAIYFLNEEGTTVETLRPPRR